MSFNIKGPIKVIVVDDHPLVRGALQGRLENNDSFALIATCKNREELMSHLSTSEVDVLVLDYVLGGKETIDGLQLIKQLRAHYPRLKILVYSAIESPALVKMILKAGVKGYISKSKEVSELTNAIITVARGKRVISEDMQYELDKFSVTEKSMEEFVLPRPEGKSGTDIDVLIKELTARENEVIRCYLDGMTIQQIAIKFNRSRKTVSGHKQAALRKLGMNSDLDLFRFKEFWIQS